MRVLLVQTPLPEREHLGGSRSLALVTNRIAPLGLGYLAAAGRRAGHDVAVYAPGTGGSHDDVLSRLETSRFDLVGLSVTTPYYAAARRLVMAIRSGFPRMVVLLGGSHPTALPERTLEEIPAHAVVVGEGELTFVEILERLCGGDRELDGIPGTAVASAGGVVRAPARPLVEDLDTLEQPARDLLPPLRDQRPTPASYRRLPLGVLFTSRGCPFPCTFCDTSVFGDRFRVRSPAAVCAEVEDLVRRHGAHEIRFFDDDFAHDRDRVLDICDRLQRFRPRVPWTCLMNAHEADADLLGAMRRAGCWQVLYGLESGSPAVLKRLRKPLTLEGSRRAVRLAREAGLSVRADFLVGTPGESLAEMHQTVEFAIRNRLDLAHFNKFMPYPGTVLYEQLVAAGHEFDFLANWSDTDHGVAVYVPEGVDPGEYEAFLDDSYRRFYLRPAHWLRSAASIRTLTQARGYAIGALSILGL
jgi:anaerobic magnesium-protoporphyrin IX monomethyl ester cyclase